MKETKLNATQVLRDDHKKIKGLLRQFEAIGLRAQEMERGVAEEIFMELEIHSSVEEQVFYPALLSALSAGEQPGRRATPAEGAPDPGIVGQAVQDHLEIRQTIRQLRSLVQLDSTAFQELFGDLSESVEGHFSIEEAELLPRAERLLGAEDLAALAARMLALRAALLQQPQYQDAQARVVQNPKGGEQMRKDQGQAAA